MAQGKRRSLTQYLAEKKRAAIHAACVVCKLPGDIRKELRTARTEGITRGEIAAWLTKECRIRVTDRDLQSHYAAHHERA